MEHDGSLTLYQTKEILESIKLKASADDKFNVAQIIISASDWEEHIVGKGENAFYQHFLLFLQCFQKPSSIGP